MLQCVVVCFSVLQCVAVVSWSTLSSELTLVLQCVVVRCSVLQGVAVYCRVLQRVAGCCSVLQSFHSVH